ncbi:hypothetical protein QWY84_12485 [Aquisalimonas lutea]|uniref:hypothetical protein n=1 Tax=Aquisalimonas lutea TaxID=1327750 RepID=UPI0025B42AD1|nr:hypothetical protein [Aquisalimonas lutea]MDN3518430.1 hypothetical protein [Aquisalimonas lutea]
MRPDTADHRCSARAGLCLRTAAAARRRVHAARVVALIAVVAATVAPFSSVAPHWLEAGADSTTVLLLACLVYMLLLTVPFVPSVELGVLIMVVFGEAGALGAYAATSLGLNLAFGIGRHLDWQPYARQIRIPASLKARMDRLARCLPTGLVPAATLALLLNLPGNTAVGGGGGIALVYGGTRLLTWPRFAVTVALATAILPGLFVLGAIGVQHLPVPEPMGR